MNEAWRATWKRFWAAVDTESQSPCWHWGGSIKRQTRAHGGVNTYGHLWHKRQQWLAHRLAYTWLVRPLKRHEKLEHTCGNALCVHPAHLRPVASRKRKAAA